MGSSICFDAEGLGVWGFGPQGYGGGLEVIRVIGLQYDKEEIELWVRKQTPVPEIGSTLRPTLLPKALITV